MGLRGLVPDRWCAGWCRIGSATTVTPYL